MARAQLGIQVKEFFDLAPIEFYYALESLSETRRAQSREGYEIARFNAWMDIQTNPYVKNKPKTPKDVVQFEWEKVAVQSIEEMKFMFHAIEDAFDPKKKKKKKKVKYNPPPPRQK